MKHKVIVLTLLLAIICSSIALGADLPSEVRQISYELQIVELTKSDVTLMGISFPEPEDLLDPFVRSITKLIHSPSLIQVLRTGASIFNIHGGQTKEQKARLAQPQLTIALGDTGKLRLSTETWIGNPVDQTFRGENYGLELHLTPVRVGKNGEQIYTEVSLSTLYGQEGNGLLTSVWTEGGSLEPIGVLSYLEQFSEANILKEQEKYELRYFAVYLKAQAISQLEDTQSVHIGTLGGLTELLWPGEANLQESSLAVTLPVKPLSKPEVDLDWWITKRVKMGFSTTGVSRYNVELGLGLFDQDLLVGAKLIGGENQTYVALGLTDQVQVHPSMLLSAGIYPVVFSLSEQKFKSELSWWMQMEVADNKFYGRLKYENEIEAKSWLGDLGYQLNPRDTVFLRYKTDFDDLKRLSIGYRRKF